MQINNKTVHYWLELSEYDITVAESMFEKGHYLYVGFMCHQAVEKALKAIYVDKEKTLPPYTHKLDKLIEITGLQEKLSEDNFDLIDELTPLNVQARYPAYKELLHGLIGKEKAKEILIRTGELISWLKARLKLPGNSENT